MAHAAQSIWMSAGSAVPGDLTDGRFNLLVLEHGYQSLRGAYTWATPGQFFPEANTLGLSETHAGTLPLYASARLLGLDLYRAFQVWFACIALLNAVALVRLLRAVGVDTVTTGPCLLLGVASAPVVWMSASHAQVLPFFPMLFAFSSLVRYARTRDAWEALASIGWTAWQFAASPYLAFFGCVAALPWLVASVTGSRVHAPAVSRTAASIARTAGIALVGILLGGVALAIYLQAIRSGHSRPISELLDLAPHLRAWLAPAHGHWWSQVIGSDHAPRTDGLLAGFTAWGLFALAVVAVVSGRIDGTRRRWLITCAAAVVLVGVLFTAPADGEPSLFVLVATHLEPLRAFRASGRFIVIALPLVAVAIGLGISSLREAGAGGRLGRVLLTAVPVLAAGETLVLNQPRVPIEEARLRTRAVELAWTAAGDRPVLAFAPGFSNQASAEVHLDAWSAALATRRVTLNGYSGGLPGSHFAFRFNPTEPIARELIRSRALDPAGVSIVTGWDAAIAQRLGITQLPSRPTAQLAGCELQPLDWTLSVDLESFVIEGRPAHQFTPPAEVRFALPDGARHVTGWIAMRPGAYSGDGASDGASITWSVRVGDGTERILDSLLLNPRDVPAHRGWVPVRLDPGPGSSRILILSTGYGPAGDGAWDWPLVSGLRAE